LPSEEGVAQKTPKPPHFGNSGGCLLCNSGDGAAGCSLGSAAAEQSWQLTTELFGEGSLGG